MSFLIKELPTVRVHSSTSTFFRLFILLYHRQTSDETEPIAKKTDGLVSAGDADRNKPDNSIPERLNQSQETHLPIKGTLQNGVECIGILPGIGFYAHSSDESSNSDSSDEDLTEIIGTVHRGKKGH